MNNFKKIGVSALAGSLAMVSANAVEYSMSGGLMAVYTTQDSNLSTESGRGIGTATDLAFKASGELDNGFTVDYVMNIDTDAALSNTSAQMIVGMGSMGVFRINNEFGSMVNAIDDVMPTAYNETWDGLTGASSDPSFFGSSTSKGSFDYRLPTQSYAGTDINIGITYDPAAGAGAATKGGISNTAAGTAGSGQGYAITMKHESGLEIGGGLEVLDDDQGQLLSSGTERQTGYIKFSSAGFTLAAQEAYQNSMNSTATEGADKEATFWGVSYAAGDISVSYGESTLQTMASSNAAVGAEIQLESVQAAYTMGAMTISAAISETANVGGTANAKYEESTLAVSFAF